MTHDISMLDLFLQAGLLVKIVMLTLLGMSIVSWAMIIKRSKVLSQAAKGAETFEDQFWSGADLAALYQNAKKRKDDISGTGRNLLLGLYRIYV